MPRAEASCTVCTLCSVQCWLCAGEAGFHRDLLEGQCIMLPCEQQAPEILEDPVCSACAKLCATEEQACPTTLGAVAGPALWMAGLRCDSLRVFVIESRAHTVGAYRTVQHRSIPDMKEWVAVVTMSLTCCTALAPFNHFMRTIETALAPFFKTQQRAECTTHSGIPGPRATCTDYPH
jgi:hypothetical protein